MAGGRVETRGECKIGRRVVGFVCIWGVVAEHSRAG